MEINLRRVKVQVVPFPSHEGIERSTGKGAARGRASDDAAPGQQRTGGGKMNILNKKQVFFCDQHILNYAKT